MERDRKRIWWGPAKRADFDWKIVGNQLQIIDLDQGNASVTNDVERVLDDIYHEGIDLDRFVILYRDSTGQWDQIVTEDNRFARFVSIICQVL